MSTFGKSEGTQITTAAPSSTMSNWTVDDIRKSDILVFRESKSEYVDSVVCPNGLQVGLLDEAFVNDLLVVGNITGSGVIYASTAFSGSLQTLIDGSDYLRGDNGITITNDPLGFITISGGGASSPPAYTAGDGIVLNATEFSADPDLTTIGFDSNNKLTTLATPQVMSAGNGLVGSSFDGSVARTFQVQAVAASPIIVTSSGLDLSLSAVSAVTVASSDELIVSHGGNIGKATVQDIINLGIGNSSLIPTDAEYIVTQAHSGLSNEKVISDGDGINLTSTSNSLTVSAVVKNNGGLEFITGELAVKVGDFTGFGLTDNAGTIDLNVSAFAGAGLTQNGNVLDVDFGPGSNQAARGSNTIEIGAGDGIRIGGTATIGVGTGGLINLEIDTVDFAGVGTIVNNNNIDVNLVGSNGISISTGASNELIIDGSGVTGIIDYDDSVNIVTNAYDGTADTVDGDLDRVLLYDHSDQKVKFIKPDQMPGGVGGGTSTIGDAEDNDYTDGLFTDFTSTTQIGTAVDRFNEVLKALAPSPAPELDDIDYDSISSSATAKLSFGPANPISGYADVAASPTNFTDEDVNGEYDPANSGNDLKIGVLNGSEDVTGTLNADVSADGQNYLTGAFGDGDKGTLKLFVNDDITPIHEVDLTVHVSGPSLNGNGSGFSNISAATSGEFPDGTSFDTFKHRTGEYIVAANYPDQRDGWNYLKVVHTVAGVDRVCNYVEWVNDSQGVSIAITSSNDTLTNLTMSGEKYLSGVKYHTSGTADYSINIQNAYKNVFPTTPITISGGNIVSTNDNFDDIGNLEDETKEHQLALTVNVSSGISILNDAISAAASFTHPLKEAYSSGPQQITGLLYYDRGNGSQSVTVEPFRNETFRMVEDSNQYDDQSDASNPNNAWDSTESLIGASGGHNTGLLVYDEKLVYPLLGANSGNFSTVTNGPSGNVDYSAATGIRYFFRRFQNNSGGSKTNFNLSLTGSGNIVSYTDPLNTTDIRVFCKLPNNGSYSTDWLDCNRPSLTNQQATYGDGCLWGPTSWGSITQQNEITFGGQTILPGEYIIVKVEADAAWTGNISQMSITWV